jgi:glycerol-3-phosphate acyltransferase PlsX
MGSTKARKSWISATTRLISDKRIAIDAMGGDVGAALTVPAAVQALETIPNLHLFLVGDENQIGPLLSGINAELKQRLQVIHTDVGISDADKPGNVLRNSKQSSMYLAVQMLQQGAVEAMVSAGNTGALLMIGRHLLKTIKGIQKPAIVAAIPGASRQSYLLDVGANLECDAQQLFEFAVMGSVLAESLNAEPARVGLLNIGSEHYKGTNEVRAAGALLEQCTAIKYVGFVEANEVFSGDADVVVCDGFVGNVMIKSSAGVANVVQRLLARQIEALQQTSSADTSATALLSGLGEQINTQRLNGASLLGLQGSIIKSHGNATVEGFCYAIREAVNQIENAVPQLIAKKVAAIIDAN